MSALLSIVITGEVDHGKSSLLGRLLEESGAIAESRVETVKKICAQSGKEFEPAFLLDAFEEEQTQGITIDISQIYFSSKSRHYRIIDSPGHRDFLKNMVTGSSAADAAVLLIDAKEGIRDQSRRHCYLLKLLGIDTVVVVINKMDLQDYLEAPFKSLCEELEKFLKDLELHALFYIPVSAKYGENVSQRGQANQASKMSWYHGPTLLEAMDQLPGRKSSELEPLRFPVQDVYKIDDQRIIVGKVESGRIDAGAEYKVWPAGQSIKVKSLERWKAPDSVSKISAVAGESIGVTLAEQVFMERGGIIAPVDQPIPVSDQLEATLFWMGKRQAAVGRRLRIKLLTQDVECEIVKIRSIMDTNLLTRQDLDRKYIDRHEVAEVLIKTARPLAMDAFKNQRSSGRFVLIDDGTVAGGGIISRPLVNQSDNLPKKEETPSSRSVVTHHESSMRSVLKALSWRLSGFLATFVLVKLFTGSTKAALGVGVLEAIFKVFLFFIHERLWNRLSLGRREIKPLVLWFTGLPCAGKSTISEAVYEKLKKMDLKVEHLDGDAVRFIFPQTGFSLQDRNAHVQRVGYLASKLTSNGVFVIASFVSPYREGRLFVRRHCQRFIEIHISTPLEICEQRDVKGMYAKARKGEIQNFTGVSDPYEVPENPELTLDTSKKSLDACVEEVMQYLKKIEPNTFGRVR